jgi:hypothetical protein
MSLPSNTLDYAIRKIAIIDENKNEAEMAESEVEAAGFEPLVIRGHFNEVEDLTSVILGKAQGALCGHRLSHSGLADFPGAKLVAHLYDLKVPAILVTQFADIDNGVSIRNWRDKIPVLLSRDEADASSIAEGLESCLQELQGQIPSTRKPYRTLLRIVNIGTESGERVIDVIIPGWNPYRAVRFPAVLLPKSIRKSHTKEGTHLFAKVNIGAEKASELYFKDFEVAEEPDEDDGLA